MGVIVPNAEDAYQLLHTLFDAQKIQENIADLLSGIAAKVIHVGVGDIVLQYIAPLTKEGIWYNHMANKGPGIHHLTYYVENIEETLDILEKVGGVTPLSTINIDLEKLYPSEYVNETAKTIYIMDTLGKIGFHLAFSEYPTKKELNLPKPKYPTGFDTLIGDASTMLHVELTTSDNDSTFDFLNKLFGTDKVEKEFSSILDSDFMRIIHVNLSNVVLQYCQPVGKERTWYELLQKNGPYVHNLNWCVSNIKKTVEKFKKEKVPMIFENWLSPDSPPFYMMDTLGVLGFHLEHGEAPKTKEGFEFVKNWFFTDFEMDYKE
jgi:catechol 2,3-dioxygenase-like lactoylglutathione lyase family enzyme